MGWILSVQALWARLRGGVDSGISASAGCSMRLVRPLAFIGLSFVLVMGWNHPQQMKTFFEATSSAPEWIQIVVFTLMGGLATEKVIRAVKKPGDPPA